jgi:putative membrane protein
MRSLFWIAAATLACGLPAARAATPQAQAPYVHAGEGAPARNAATMGNTDLKFMTAAAQAGLAETANARIALERSKNPGVRKYAQQLLADHEAAQMRLQKIAEAKGLKLPTEPTRQQQDDTRDLQKHQGEDFDQAFLRRMVLDHQKAIDVFGHEVKGRHQDGDLKNFAQQMVVVLQRHMGEAEKLQTTMGHLPGT